MKEYTFNARTFHWNKDEKGFDILVVHCFESEDARLVINCGAHQKRFVDQTAPEGLVTDEMPG